MKPQNLIHILTGIVCIGLLPQAQAVSPPPDGGYPGGNTAEGQAALLSRTTGGYNTAVGLLSLRSLTIGSFNTAIGAGTLLANFADDNTATGAGALLSNTIGGGNTANGGFALFNNTEGFSNTAVGDGALQNNTTGHYNVANGAFALYGNIDGGYNVANGASTLYSNTGGGYNVANGSGALNSNTTGNNNVALGAGAGIDATTGSNNVYIGAGMQGVAGESNACYIASIFGQTSASGTAVFINSNGKLGTLTSSRRFKDNIQTMGDASEVILALKPVSFRYKKEVDPKGIPQFGLVAEDVEAINPDLVVRDKYGTVNTVRYDAINAMLLNEFLKEHRKVQELTKDFQATVAQLTARLDEQASQIQKVSAQLEAGKAAPQVVNNL